MLRSILTSLLLFTAPFVAYTQQRASVDDYIEQVLSYSFTLQIAESKVAEADYTLLVARTARLPALSASGSFYYHLRHIEGQKPWTMAVEPTLVETLYGGGVVRSTIEQAELGVGIAAQNAEYTRLEVIYAARSAYWNYWGVSRYHAAMREYVEIIRREYEAIERRYTEGYTSKGDLLMIASRLSEAQYSLASAEQSRLIAKHNLNILKGYSPDDSVTMVRGVDVSDFVLPRRVEIVSMMEQRPDYLALLLSELVAQANVRSVRGAYNPTLVGGAVGAWRTNTPNFSGDTFFDGSLYVSLSVPIFNFSKRSKSVAEAREKERQSALQVAAMRDQIILDESNAWSRVSEGYMQVMIARESLVNASENLEISTYSYNEGLVSIVDLIQAQISWIQLYTNAINSQYAYQLSVAEYLLVTGGGQ